MIVSNICPSNIFSISLASPRNTLSNPFVSARLTESIELSIPAPIEISIIDEPIVDWNFTLLLKIIMHLLTICHQFLLS